ncbi:MAG: hypothetical protein IKL09_02485, partial [Clostridia bacterium]|nr:hypothetical protein [Clostridia bacterium]
ELHHRATVIDIPVEMIEEDVNLHKLTQEQQEECTELYEIYKVNPKLAEDKFAEILKKIEENCAPQKIINEDYAALVVLKRSKAKWEQIGGYFDA